MTSRTDEKKVEHGCREDGTAFYRGTGGVPCYQPTLQCSCNEMFTAPTWEEAGADFDAHLEKHLEKDGR